MKYVVLFFFLFTLGNIPTAQAALTDRYVYCYPNSATQSDNTCSTSLYGVYPQRSDGSSSDGTYQYHIAIHKQCVPGSISSAGWIHCNSCNAGYYLVYRNPETCKACPSACTACSSATSCSSCKTGYYLSGGSCNTCPTGCTSCSSASSCSSCASGYKLVSGKCQPATVSSCPSRMTLSSDGCCCVNK